jgi:hypothetical protein
MNVAIICDRCLTMLPASQDGNVVLVLCRANFSCMPQFRALDHGKVTCFKRVVAFEVCLLQLPRAITWRVCCLLPRAITRRLLRDTCQRSTRRCGVYSSHPQVCGRCRRPGWCVVAVQCDMRCDAWYIRVLTWLLCEQSHKVFRLCLRRTPISRHTC